MTQCIHGTPLTEPCYGCTKDKEKEKDIGGESLHAQTNVLLQKLIELQGVMLETMANLAHKVETIEHALKERIIEESNQLQYQDGDRSRQAAEAGSSDSAKQSERGTEETKAYYEAAQGVKEEAKAKAQVWMYCRKHHLNFKQEEGDCLYCMQERDKTREVKLTGFDPYGDKDQ